MTIHKLTAAMDMDMDMESEGELQVTMVGIRDHGKRMGTPC